MPFTQEELQSLTEEGMSDAVFLMRFDFLCNPADMPQETIYFTHAGKVYIWGEFDEWRAMDESEAIAEGIVYGPPLPPKVDPNKPIGKSSSRQGATMRYWIVYGDRSYEPIAKAKWISLLLPEVSI